MGLLGDSIEDPRTMAVLRLAGALQNQRGGGFGGLLSGLNAGGQDYIQTIAAAKQQEEAQKREALKQQLLQQQLQESQAEAQARAEARKQAQAAAQAQAQRQAQFGQALNPAPMSGTQAAALPGGPTQANAARIGSQQAPNWEALAMQFPDQIETIKKLSEAQNFGRAEVARTMKGMVNGREQEQQFDKFGRPVGAGLEQFRAPIQTDTGGKISFRDPYSLAEVAGIGKTQDPNSIASNGLAWARLNFDKQKDARAEAAGPAGGKYEYKQDANGNWMALPKEVTPGAPIQPIPVTAPNKNIEGAKKAIAIIDAAGPLIDKSTGSYIGAGVDMVGKAFGKATDGAVAASQLKALEGALMMSQPRMEGPQSNADVLLYKQMAGQIGDPTVPAPQKHAALATIRQLHERYAGGTEATPAKPAAAPTMRWNPKTGTFDMIGGG